MISLHETTGPTTRQRRRWAISGRTRGAAPHRPGRLVWLALTVLLSAFVSAQDATEKRRGPPVPVQPAPEEVRAALEAAEAELAELEERIAAEARGYGERVAAAQKEVFDLQGAQEDIREEIRILDKELVQLEEEVFEARDAYDKSKGDLESVDGEIRSQLAELEGRVQNSLLAAERPDLIAGIRALAESAAGSPKERVEELLRIYEIVLDGAETVGVVAVPVKLSGATGLVKKIDVLRVGLLSGFYADAEAGEAGFVLGGPGEDSESFTGEATGLKAAQKSQIARLVDDPAGGGSLPFDVTGGSGIATLRSKDSMARWFEIGGVFMYPLLILAAFALLLSIERGITLAVRSAGMKRRLRQVIALVESGQLEEAERRAEKWGGAVGGVCRAALAHHHQGRDVMEDAVQEALLHHAPSYHSRLGFIALCAAIAPLMGLLGTVTGMITTFKMVTLFGTSDPRFMAGGISEALITTQGGLYVAIPSLLLRGILGAVADAAVGRLEAGAMSLVRAILGRDQQDRTSVHAEPAPTTEHELPSTFEETGLGDSSLDREESELLREIEEIELFPDSPDNGRVGDDREDSVDDEVPRTNQRAGMRDD